MENNSEIGVSMGGHVCVCVLKCTPKKKKKKKREEVISMHMIDQGECRSAHTERDD